MMNIPEEHPWTAFGASEDEWNDWRWQLRNAVNTREKAERFIQLTEDEREGIAFSQQALPFQVTPYFLSLADPIDPDCPLRRQAIPSKAESERGAGEFRDPLGEDLHSPVPGIVHKYEEHVLFLVTDRCAGYCRHCTRRRLAGGVCHREMAERDPGCSAPDAKRIPDAISYIRSHREIRDVLVSGGDPLLLSDSHLCGILQQIRSISHVQIIRIGTRVPAFLPMRVTEELAKSLRQFSPLYVITHFNHVREITPAAEKACGLLADHGIPLENQTVLLRGINSEAGVLKALFERLLAIRVRPYYLHQLDLAQGIEHFRTPISTGPELLKSLRGHTSGLAIPHLAVDLPLGYGKVTVSPDFVERRQDGRTYFRNWQGELCPEPYPDPAETDCTCPYEHREQSRGR